MSFFSFGFKRSRPAAAPTLSQLGPPPSQVGGSAGSQGRSRRELLRVVLRDTLHRYGIPPAWFDAEVLVSTSRNGERGIHWRLVVKNSDPRLLGCAIALQHALIKRLTTFDPLASAWLTGLSWQYAPAEEAPYPAMPHPSTWKEPPIAGVPSAAAAVAGGSGDVIAGPEVIHLAPARAGQDAEGARSDLEQLFAARDADFRRHAMSETAGEDATQPMFLGTEPAKL
jgi:hypothetical protein